MSEKEDHTLNMHEDNHTSEALLAEHTDMRGINPSNLTKTANNSETRGDEPQETADSEKAVLEAHSEVAPETRMRNSGLVRAVVLLLACLMMFGPYFCFDLPSFLQPQIEYQMFGYDITSDHPQNAEEAKLKYSFIYASQQLPNVIMPIFGGYFLDRWGVRICSLIFMIVISVGQLLFAFSSNLGDGWNTSATFAWVMAGRFVLSLTSGSSFTAQSIFINKWFYGNALALAMGLRITCGRLGTVLAGWLLPYLYKKDDNNLFSPFIISAILCCTSIVFVILLNFIDHMADKQEKKIEEQSNSPEKKGSPMSFKDIRNFSYLFWLIALSFLLNFPSIFVALSTTGDLLHKLYQVPQDEAGRYLSIPYLISALLVPMMGKIADRIGNRQYIILTSSIIILTTHILWFTLKDCPEPAENCSSANYILPLILTGFAYSLYTGVIYPSVPIVVPQANVGTAFGLCMALMQIGMFIMQVVVGVIQGKTNTPDDKYGYYWSSVFFICMGCLCVIVSVLTVIENKRKGNTLGKGVSAQKQKQIMKQSSFFEQK